MIQLQRVRIKVRILYSILVRVCYQQQSVLRIMSKLGCDERFLCTFRQATLFINKPSPFTNKFKTSMFLILRTNNTFHQILLLNMKVGPKYTASIFKCNARLQIYVNKEMSSQVTLDLCISRHENELVCQKGLRRQVRLGWAACWQECLHQHNSLRNNEQNAVTVRLCDCGDKRSSSVP